MTPEQRLDRLERIALMFVQATLRDRKTRNDVSEKIDILIDSQIRAEDRLVRAEDRLARSEELLARNEELFIKNEERFAKNEERFAKNEERLTRTEKALEQLVAAQARTVRMLQTLIKVVHGKDLGESLA